MPLKRVLALDLGTNCGWAIYREGQRDSGVQKFDLKRGESPGMRYIRFNSWLEEVFNYLTPELVVYEMAHHRGGFSTELLLGMVTRVLEWCARRDCNHTSVHSATLKKFATGSGRGDKQAVMKFVSDKWGRPVLDDNEADALALLAWAENEHGFYC